MLRRLDWSWPEWLGVALFVTLMALIVTAFALAKAEATQCALVGGRMVKTGVVYSGVLVGNSIVMMPTDLYTCQQ